MAIWEIVFYGFIIGVIVSAPMGPIGMLVIQRTFLRGRWHGLVTGLGASLSDILYAFITLMGMSVITEFLQREEVLLQIFGSILVLFFGYTVFKTNPLSEFKPNMEIEETRYRRDFVTSFLLTFSNFAIIFLFIALFSRFNYIPYENGVVFLVLGLLSIAGGAIFWWFFITTYISKLRKYVSRKGLTLMNRIVGALFILIGLIGTITAFL